MRTTSLDTTGFSHVEVQFQPKLTLQHIVRLKLKLHDAEAYGVFRLHQAQSGRRKLKDHDAKAYGV